MSVHRELSYDQKIERVKGIQFSVLSPDDIVKGSVVEVTKTDTYTGNDPVPGGLFDPRMGILEHNSYCRTCEQKKIFCPGHFGHITLAKPVFHPMFYETTRKLLKCICYRCSRLLISPTNSHEDIKKIMNKIIQIKNNQKRWEQLFKYLNTNSKIKKCGDDGAPGCSAVQPSRYSKEGTLKIVSEFAKTESEEARKMEFSAELVLTILQRMSESDMEILGFNPKFNRPEWMICTVLPVPPPPVRPTIVEENGQRREDDLTHKLCDIIKTNNQLKARIEKGNANEEHIAVIIGALQYHIATLIDNQMPGIAPAQQRNGRKLKSVSDRLKKKEGRIRGNLNGKRVDQSARSVITPDPYISLDQLGVPIKIAMNLTFREVVNKYNIDEMRKLVTNGPEVWPGAKEICKREDNKTYTLKYGNREKLAEELVEGDVVNRHLRDDDYVLFNRQPSLHKMSMMCHRVKVMPYQTFRLNVLVTSPYNADFDGDEMNLHVPQSIQTMNELKDFAAVPYHIIGPKDGKPVIEVVQDTMLGSFRITKDNVRISDKNFANLQMVNSYFDGMLPEPFDTENHSYNGLQASSQIIPPGFHLELKNRLKDKVRIVNGVHEQGMLDKSIFHGMSTGILPVIYHDYSPFEVRRYLDNLQRLICRWLLTSGFSVGISDLVVDKSIKSKISKIIKDMKTKAYDQLEKVRLGKLENNSITNNQEFFEQELIGILNGSTSEIEKNGLENINHYHNRMINMVQSGSKGKPTNVNQMIACVGQQNVDGKRVAYGFTDRTLPHYFKYDDGPEARGFVENSFISGLTPQEMFFHAMGGREGLIDTAVKSVSGDTTIIVIENNKPRHLEIGDWIDTFLETYPRDIVIEDDRPDLEFLKIDDKVKVYIPTTDDKGNVSWEHLTAVTRHDTTEYIYEVTTAGGRKVVVADSESLLVWDNIKEEYIKKHSSIINEGDIVPVTMNMNKTPPYVNNYIDMTEYFSKNEYVYGTEFNKCVKLMKEAQGDKFHIPSGWYEDNNGKTFTLPYISKARIQRTLVRSNTENILNEYIYPYHATREHSHLPDKFALDYDNGVMFGLYLADGCIHEKSGTISITKDDKSVQEFVCKWFDKYSITHRIDVSNKTSGVSTSVIGSSTLFAKFFKQLMGHGSRVKHVPDLSYTAPDEFVKGLLSGYISGDGCIEKGAITASSASKRLIEDIAFLCSRIGVFAKISISKLKSNNFKTTDIATSHRLSIRAQWGRMLAKELNLVHNDKNNKLKNMDFSSNHRNFKEINDTVMDTIVKITKVKAEGKYSKLYDVTVPSTLNFQLSNGLQVRDTSETGYIQRRLVKAMEDIKVTYDYTVRNANEGIVQYIYGEDGMEGTKIESQRIPYIDMDIMNIHDEYNMSIDSETKVYMTEKAFKDTKADKNIQKRLDEYYEKILSDRLFLIEKIFKNQKSDRISYPIPFERIISNSVKRTKDIKIDTLQSDLTPMYILDTIESIISDDKDKLTITDNTQGTKFLHILLRTHLSPKKIIYKYHMQKDIFDWIVSEIRRYFNEAIAPPGEMVGIIAAQSLGEPSTQLTLDSFHVSGTAAAVKATSGVPRLKELLSVSRNIKTPTLQIYLKPEISSTVNPEEDDEGKINDTRVYEAKERTLKILKEIEITTIKDLLISSSIYWDPIGQSGFDTTVENDNKYLAIYREFNKLYPNKCSDSSPWVLRLLIDKVKLYRCNLTTLDVHMEIYKYYGDTVECLFSDDNDEEIVMHMRINKTTLQDTDSSDMVASLKAIEHNIVNSINLKGISKIKKVSMRQYNHNDYNSDKEHFEKINEWILDTDGSNLMDIMAHPAVDSYRTFTNDVQEIYSVLGIEAARNALANEILEVIKESSINYRHISILIDTMTCKGNLMSIDRHGINRGDVGPLAKSSFEETTDMLIKASIFSDYDKINGVSANIMLGQMPPCGTGDSEILLNEQEYVSLIEEKINYIPEQSLDESVEESCMIDTLYTSSIDISESTENKINVQLPEITLV
jgi:DNA-directed RNA polymerase beta' subunit